jgi:hypothetical protein
MVRGGLLALAIGSLTSGAWALPVLSPGHSTRTSDLLEVRVICTVDGQCKRPPHRRPVARWIYGDGAFFGPGPYSGPGYYGPPGSHWRWFPFFGF